MHFNTTVVVSWCYYALLFLTIINITEALDYDDFGLPNENSCVLTFNKTVYIFNTQKSLSIQFSQPWNDTAAPQITRLNDTHNYFTSTVIHACSITGSGKVVLIPQLQQPLQVLQANNTNSSWKLNNNITYLGSQNAIDTFITNIVPVSFPYAITSFNEYIIFYNGNQTFTLDTRYETLWVFYEVLDDPTTNTPLINNNSSSTAVLYATSRWILSFRQNNEANNIVYVDCFDPYSFQWLGTIAGFNTSLDTTNDTRYTTIQAVPIASSAANMTLAEVDSLLIIIIATVDSQQKGATNAETIMEFWNLDISTWIPNNFTLTKLNPTIKNQHQSDVTFLTDLDAVAAAGDGGSVVVTPIDDEMTLFYGGANQLQFLNTTSLSFLPQPQWLTITTGENNITTTEGIDDSSQPTSNDNHLAIILGSVLGGLSFLGIILLFWCCCRRKRRRHHSQNRELLRPNDNNNVEEKKPSSSVLRKNWLLLLLGIEPNRASGKERGINNNNRDNYEESPSIPRYTLSPIAPISPIHLFPLPSDTNNHAPPTTTSSIVAAVTNNDDEGIIVQQRSQPSKVFKSRFREVFDYHSFPLTRHNNSNALEGHATSSNHNNK